MFGGPHRIDEAKTARASWGDTSETRQPWRRDPRAVGKVCSWTEKIRIKSLETAGVVRDNAVIGQVDFVEFLPSLVGCFLIVPFHRSSSTATTPRNGRRHFRDAQRGNECGRRW